MARPIWNGFISFGLVNIPIILYTAENHREIHFHLYDRKTNSRVGYSYVNKETGKKVDKNDLIKGYELKNGNIITIDNETLNEIAGENTKTIAIENFVKRENIDIVDYALPYYLVPDKKGEKGYLLLLEVLKKTNRVGIAKVIIHSHERLAAIMPYKGALILELLRYHQEIREPNEFSIPEENTKKYKITASELKVAEQLVNAMATSWKPSSYKNEYQLTLKNWLKEREKKQKPMIKMTSRANLKEGNIVNFVDLLKKSMQQKIKKKKT